MHRTHAHRPQTLSKVTSKPNIVEVILREERPLAWRESDIHSIALGKVRHHKYRVEKKSWYVVARNFFLLLLNFSAWPCLGPA